MSGAQRGGLHRRPQTCISKGPCEEQEEEAGGEEKAEAGASDQPRGVVARAQEDPDSLTPQETMRLVRMVCAKALHQDGAARVLAELCVTVIKKQRSSSDFAELLLESCNQWFIRHEELLPRRVQKAGRVAHGGDNRESCYRWTLFVAFLSELLARTAECGTARRHACPLAVLLCECCELMLLCPAQDALDEMKCLRSALVVARAAAESVASEAMKNVAALMGRASVDPRFPPEAQEIILELVHQCGRGKRPGTPPSPAKGEC